MHSAPSSSSASWTQSARAFSPMRVSASLRSDRKPRPVHLCYLRQLRDKLHKGAKLALLWRLIINRISSGRDFSNPVVGEHENNIIDLTSLKPLCDHQDPNAEDGKCMPSEIIVTSKRSRRDNPVHFPRGVYNVYRYISFLCVLRLIFQSVYFRVCVITHLRGENLWPAGGHNFPESSPA